MTTPKQLLKLYKIKPRKEFSQNFLNPTSSNKFVAPLVDFCKTNNSIPVIEIGPGPGSLTRPALKNDCKVIGIEKDGSFEPILEQLKAEYPEKFDFIIGDALDYDNLLETLKSKNWSDESVKNMVIYGNLPFAIGGTLLHQYTLKTLKGSLSPSMYFMFNKKFAERLLYINCTRTKFAILTNLAFKVEFCQLFPRSSFSPSPSEDCVQLSFHPKDPVLSSEQVDSFVEFMDQIYTNPNKDLIGVLRKHFNKEILAQIDMDLNKKVHQLSSLECIELFKKVTN